ncbi:MAG: photosynthetic reaction center cytochrome c subunit [Comamonadaceae bacterium]|nr:MAG: photosynthetic reaction center cytochrome c subunit [Comamonadaceae bacterium]
MSSRHTLSLIALLGAAAMLGACERPPVVSTQIGYRGVAMEQIDNPRLVAERSSLNEMPAPQRRATRSATGCDVSSWYGCPE